MTNDLHRYSDTEIRIMMREAITRIGKSNAMDRESVRDLYAEFATRPLDRRDDKERKIKM